MTTTPNPINTRNVPPPPTPLVDLQTGYPTKPWWRWFSWLNTVITIVVNGETQLLTPADLSGEVADLQKRIENLEVLTQTPRTDGINDDPPEAPYVPPLGTNSNFGVVRGDGITIDVDNGVVSTMPQTFDMNFVIDGAGATISTGIAGDIGPFDFDFTITAVTLLADQSGSIQLDLWVDTYANYPPTVADTIVAAAPPTISTAVKSQDTTLTGWTTAISSGDTMRVNVDSATSITRCVVGLKYTR